MPAGDDHAAAHTCTAHTSNQQVATTLIELHNQCLQGVTTLLEELRARAAEQAAGAKASKRQVVSRVD